jgi:hypothetical protein
MIFEDKHEPIEITLKDIEGDETVYHTALITGEKLERIQEIGKGKLKEYKTDPAKQVYDMLEIVFGIPGDNFKKYSLELLKKVMEYITGQIKKKLTKDNG